MTNLKTTKRALLSSVIALLVCFTMLVGTTFAWFTDSVTSAGNIIQTGSLNVEMHWAEGKLDPSADDTAWTDASTDTIFNNDKWEPGYVEVRHIKISNVGTLDLKYQLNIFANGDVSDLADVIDVYFVDPAVQVADRTALNGVEPVGTLTEVLAGMPGNASGDLLADETDTVTLALKMRENAGNEYQNKAIGSNFTVQLLATQLASESDSFDNQYDKDATYSGVVIPADATKVTTFEELKDALATGGDVNLSADIEVTSTLNITQNTNLYAEEGTKLSFASTAQMAVKDGATLKLMNVTVDNNDTFGFDADGKFQITDVAGRNTAAIFGVSAGSHLIIEKNTTISNVVGKNQAVVMANGTADNRATVTVMGTIKNCAGTTGSVICANKCTDVYIEDGAVLKNNVSYNSHNYGLIKIYDGSMLYMNGGEIAYNLYAGNGLIGFQSGDAVINGGIIHNNNFYDGQDSMIDSGNAINSRHGLIYAHSNSQFTINGGEIINNTVTIYGALDCGRNANTTTVTLIVNGGTIKNNLSSDGFDEFGPMIYDYFGTIAREEYVTISKNADVSGLIFDFNADYKFVTDLAK